MCSATPRQAFRSEPILLIFARKNKEKHRNATDARPFGQGEYSPCGRKAVRLLRFPHMLSQKPLRIIEKPKYGCELQDPLKLREGRRLSAAPPSWSFKPLLHVRFIYCGCRTSFFHSQCTVVRNSGICNCALDMCKNIILATTSCTYNRWGANRDA